MTTLVRFREPLRNAAMNGEFERLIKTVFESPTRASAVSNQTWAPPLDVWETEGELVYAFDLPGIPEDKIAVDLEDSTLTVSGIVLPDTAKEKPQRGKVLAVGPGPRNQETGEYIQMEVVEGDEVIFSKYGGTEIKVGADEILILRESDVLAKAVHTGGKRKRTLSGATA